MAYGDILTFAPPFYPLLCLAWITNLRYGDGSGSRIERFPIRLLILYGGSPSNSTGTLIVQVFTDFHFPLLRIPIGYDLVSGNSRESPN